MGGFIDFLPPDQDFAVLASMARVRNNEPNGTVQMFAVVPALKACHPLAGLLEAIERSWRILGPVLERPHQRLHVGVVVG